VGLFFSPVTTRGAPLTDSLVLEIWLSFTHPAFLINELTKALVLNCRWEDFISAQKNYNLALVKGVPFNVAFCTPSKSISNLPNFSRFISNI
jgi:hypothetical protein